MIADDIRNERTVLINLDHRVTAHMRAQERFAVVCALFIAIGVLGAVCAAASVKADREIAWRKV